MILIDYKPVNLTEAKTPIEKRLKTQFESVRKMFKENGFMEFVYPDGYVTSGLESPGKLSKSVKIQPAAIKIMLTDKFVDEFGSHSITVCDSYKKNHDGNIVPNPPYIIFTGRLTLSESDIEKAVFFLHYYSRLGDSKSNSNIPYIKFVDTEKVMAKTEQEMTKKAALFSKIWGESKLDKTAVVSISKTVGLPVDGFKETQLREALFAYLLGIDNPGEFIDNLLSGDDEILASLVEKAYESGIVYVADDFIMLKTGKTPRMLGAVVDENKTSSLFVIIKKDKQVLSIIQQSLLKQ